MVAGFEILGIAVNWVNNTQTVLTDVIIHHYNPLNLPEVQIIQAYGNWLHFIKLLAISSYLICFSSYNALPYYPHATIGKFTITLTLLVYFTALTVHNLY